MTNNNQFVQFLPRSDEIKAKLIKDYFQQQFNDESEPKL